MADYIGNIEVPEITASGTFPLVSDYGYGVERDYAVAVHQFGSGNAKIEQRFRLGTGARRHTVRCSWLNDTQRAALLAFWEARKGAYGAFTYNAPAEDGDGTTAVTCRFANEPLSWEMVANWACSTGVTLVEIPDPDDAPTYTVNATLSRFPSSTLKTALLFQVQEIIPLLKIQVIESGYPAIYVSDRRCTVGSQLYQARLLQFDGISQGTGGESDQASFTFGNADRVMRDLANDVDLYRASVEFSLLHVGSGIVVNLWKGEIIDWSMDAGPEFKVTAADGLYELNLPYPTRKISRTCPKKYDDGATCPYTSVGSLDLVHFPSASADSCDRSYDADNGCLAHGMKRYFGGIIAEPQGVRIKDNSTGVWGFGRSPLTSVSMVADSIYDQVLPEVYTGTAMPVNAKLAAGRDESDFYEALGVVCAGPVTFGTGHTLDGQLHHGPSSLGLREVTGTDPAGATEYFSLDEKGDQTGGDWRKVYSGGSTYKDNFAAGVAFAVIRRNDTKGLQLSKPTEHSMLVNIATGMKGWVWTATNTRSEVTLTNPVWIAVNMMLRARGLMGASATVAEGYFDLDAALAAAAICDSSVTKIIGSGSETQFQFRGIVQEEKPLRDWIQEVLMNCLGYTTFSFGKLKIGIRINSSTVEAFTEGNILFQSLQLAPLKPSFNHLTGNFADEEFDYVANSLAVYDIGHAAYLGGATGPLFLKSTANLAGSPGKSQAARIISTRLREELGGITAAEWRDARVVKFRTTVLALNVEPGMVCSMTHADMPGGAGKFRVTEWRLNPDFSIDVTGRTTTDSMYDLTTGPKPADVTADAVPTETIYPVLLPTTGSNLLANESFETGNMLGWTVVDGTAEVTTTEQHTGSASCAVDMSAACHVRSGSTVQADDGYIPASEGQAFTFTGHYKTSAGASVPTAARAYIRFYDAAKSSVGGAAYDTFSAQSSWTAFSATATAPSGTAYVLFFPYDCDNTGSGSLYLDSLLAERSLVVADPNPPTGVSLTVADLGESFRLDTTWTPPSPAGGTTRYEVQARYYTDGGGSTPEGDWIALGDVSGATAAAHASGPHPRPDATRYARTRARGANAANSGSSWVESSIQTVTAATAPVEPPADPAAPTGVSLTVTSSGERFGLTTGWTAPSPAGGTTAYQIQARYYTDAGGSSPESDWIDLGTEFGVSTAQNVSGYWARPSATRYAKTRVRGLNSDNDVSAWAESGVETVAAGTGIETPAAPTGVSVTVTSSGDRFGLTTGWTAPSPAGGTVGYQIQARYYTDSGGSSPESDWIDLATEAGVSTVTSMSGYWPRPAATRYVKTRVRGINALNAASAWAESSVATVTASSYVDTVPGDASGVSVSVTDKEGNYGLTTSWTAPSPIGSVEGYDVQARFYTDSGGSSPDSDWIPLGTAGNDVVSLESGYWPRPTDAVKYVKTRVRTYNNYNTPGANWVYSSIATVSMLANPPQPAAVAVAANYGSSSMQYDVWFDVTVTPHASPGTTELYAVYLRYYSDAGGSTPVTDWQHLGDVQPSAPTISSDRSPRHGNYVQARAYGVNADGIRGTARDSTIISTYGGGLMSGTIELWSDSIDFSGTGETVGSHSDIAVNFGAKKAYFSTGSIVMAGSGAGISIIGTGTIVCYSQITAGQPGVGTLDIYGGSAPRMVAGGTYSASSYVDVGSYKVGGTTIVDSYRSASFVDVDASGVYKMDGATIIDSSKNADFNSLKIGGTTRIDSSGNVDGASIKVGGTTRIDASGNVNGATMQLAGTTIVDSSRNAAFVNINATGSYQMDGYDMINTSGQFVGYGIRMQSYECAASVFWVWNSSGSAWSAGSTVNIGYSKSGGGTGTLYFIGGILIHDD